MKRFRNWLANFVSRHIVADYPFPGTMAAMLAAGLLLQGCATVKKDISSGVAGERVKGAASVALGAAAMAQPQYAGTIKQLQRLLDPPSKTAADDGMTPFEEWFFKGNKIDKNDLSIHCGNEKYIKPTARDLNPTKAATASTDENIVIARDDLKAILEAVTAGSQP